MIHILFGPKDILRYNCVKFHDCRIRVTDFREKGGPGSLPRPSVSSPENAHPDILIRVNTMFDVFKEEKYFEEKTDFQSLIMQNTLKKHNV